MGGQNQETRSRLFWVWKDRRPSYMMTMTVKYWCCISWVQPIFSIYTLFVSYDNKKQKLLPCDPVKFLHLLKCNGTTRRAKMAIRKPVFLLKSIFHPQIDKNTIMQYAINVRFFVLNMNTYLSYQNKILFTKGFVFSWNEIHMKVGKRWTLFKNS